MTFYDKFLLFLWCVPILGLLAFDLFSVWPSGPGRRAAMADSAARRMDLWLSLELGAAVVRRLRRRRLISAGVVSIAGPIGGAVIYFALRHTHADTAELNWTVSPAMTTGFALLSVYAFGTVLGWWRSLRRPLTGERGDLTNTRTPAPGREDVLPRWFRRVRHAETVFPVAATVYYLVVPDRHRAFDDIGVCLGCAVLVGAVFGLDRWLDRIVRAPQRPDADPAESAVDDTMRIEFVLALAGILHIYLIACSNVILAAASIPRAEGQWVFVFSWLPLYGHGLFSPNINSKYGRRLLLWHRHENPGRLPGHSRYLQAEKPLL